MNTVVGVVVGGAVWTVVGVVGGGDTFGGGGVLARGTVVGAAVIGVSGAGGAPGCTDGGGGAVATVLGAVALTEPAGPGRAVAGVDSVVETGVRVGRRGRPVGSGFGVPGRGRGPDAGGRPAVVAPAVATPDAADAGAVEPSSATSERNAAVLNPATRIRVAAAG